MSEENVNRARVKIVETLYDLLALDQVSPADVRLAFFKIAMPWENGTIAEGRVKVSWRTDVCGHRVTSMVTESEKKKMDAELKEGGYTLL